MACPEITTIPSSECIGNSLITINSNFETLKDAICEITINETGVTVEDEGSQIGANVKIVNFVGAGVNAIVSGDRAQISIPGAELIKVSGLEEQGTNSGGGRQNFFILNDGSLRVVGFNQFGELGMGVADRRVYTPRVAGFTPPLELGEGISKVYSQHNCTYLVTSFGRVYAAGVNNAGQLGIGTTSRTPTPIFTFVNAIRETVTPFNAVTNPVQGYAAAKLPGNRVIQLCTGSGAVTALLTIFALTEDGRVFVWGANNRGQAGIPQTTTGNTITTPQQSSFTGTGRLITSAGNNNNTTTFIVDTQDKLYVVGRNQDGQAGIGNNNTGFVNINSFQLVTGLPFGYRVNNVRVGGTADQITTFVTLKDGTLYAAGRGINGAVTGTTNATGSIQFVRVQGFTDSEFVEDVAVHIDSNAITCWALIRDGVSGYRLKGWGNNTSGQLGIGTIASTVPVTQNFDWPWLSTPGVNVVQVVVAGNGTQKTTLVLDSAKRLWASGYGASGLIGNGTRVTRNLTFLRVAFNPGLGYPVQIRSTNNDVTNFSNFLALLNTGKVLGWGWDQEGVGQLGVDAAPDITTVPSLVQILI
jgi:alpha-tubulin suppressor-like RCC1 family protein